MLSITAFRWDNVSSFLRESANGLSTALERELPKARYSWRSILSRRECGPGDTGVLHFVRGELRVSLDVAIELQTLAARLKDPGLMLESYVAKGLTLFSAGDITPSHRELEAGMRTYDPSRDASHATIYGQDPGVVCLSWFAWALGLLGSFDQAMERAKERKTAAARAHWFSCGFAWRRSGHYWISGGAP